MHDLLSSFLKARAFAQQTKYRRWITRPLRHLTGFFLTYVWYRVFQRSVALCAEIFTGDMIRYLDYLGFGAHCIDSNGVLLPLDDVRDYVLGLPIESDNLIFTKKPVT